MGSQHTLRASFSSMMRTPLDGVGLLQITALDNSPIAARLGNIDPNDIPRRRRAAMFPVAIIDGRLVPVGTDEAMPDAGCRVTTTS